MAGVTKKFSLNFKKNAKKRSGEPRDELEVPIASVQSLSPNLGTGHHGRSVGKSSSLGSIHSELDEEFDQEDIMALTHNVRSFSEALLALKKAIDQGSDGVEDVKVCTLNQLGEVLHILRRVLQKYPVLQSTDVLTAAAILIAKIKSYNYDDMGSDGSELLAAVDQLALAFSSSVSEYLMGDVDSYPRIGKSKSFDNLAAASRDSYGVDHAEHERVCESLSAGEMDERLHKHDAGMDIAFERAKAWARYAKEIITYVEKRAHLETELSKGLTKLAHSVKQSITEDTFLPFQSIYCTALDQDVDYANTNQATSNLLTTVKFVEPLCTRRAEHEKIRKHLRDTWAKEVRKNQESVTNLKKARNAYISRRQDHEKSRESTAKAETENLNQSTGSTQTKLDKKKKQEEDAAFKSKEAEITYQTCVVEANNSQKELEKVRMEILAQIRELIHHSDQIMKAVTTSYFQMLYSVAAAPPLQFQVLAESSGQYEPGGQYMEYIRRLPASNYTPPEPFVFHQYHIERSDGGGGRKPSTHSSGSGSDMICGEDSPHLSPRSASALGVGTKEEDDSVSGSSCKSSPSASPYPSHRQLLSNSTNSMSELLAAAAEDKAGGGAGGGGSGGVSQFRGVSLSRAAQTHVFKKLRMSSRCRHCESYVYFNGAECEKCGLTSHKKCLETLAWECGSGRGSSSNARRMTTFGVDFSAHVQENHTQIPHLVRKCVEKIDEEGIELKGIYRVSGVKSKVEKLCQSFETEPANVDLSDHHPNVVANVLKLYLRQLPEPILTFRLYPELMKLARENLEQKESVDEMVGALTSLIHKLPAANLRTLSLLIHHLHRVTQHQPTNHMSATNLAIVFGPTLLRPSEGAASLDSLMDTPNQTRIIETLILHVQTIFGEPEFPPPTASSTPSSSSTGGSGRSAGGRLDVVDEAAPSSKDPEDEKSTSWYVPEITENLLDELAKEEPRFQQMGGRSEDSAERDAQREATPSPAADDDDDDWELEDRFLPDQSDTSNSTPAQLSTALKPTGTGGVGTSPGIRRKILPSQVTPRATSPAPQMKLTKPQPFTPSSSSSSSSQHLSPHAPSSSSSATSSPTTSIRSDEGVVGGSAGGSATRLVTSTSSSSSLASGSVASGSVAAGSVASGSVASGSVASGSVASSSSSVAPASDRLSSPRGPRASDGSSKHPSEDRQPRYV